MPKDEQPNEEKHYVSTRVHKGWLIAGAALIAVVLLFGTFIVGAAAGRWPNNMYHGGHNFGGPIMREGALGMWKTADGTSKLDRDIGTVTAVNGSSFTLAGGGATVTVTTNASTQWHGGDSVRVNDTVAAFGTLNGNTLSANVVSINP